MSAEKSWIWAKPAEGAKPQHLWCERCGESADFRDLDKIPDFIGAFIAVHKWCRPPHEVRDQFGNTILFTRVREVSPQRDESLDKMLRDSREAVRPLVDREAQAEEATPYPRRACCDSRVNEYHRESCRGVQR